MSRLPAGPYKMLRTHGVDAPWYIIPFDKEGRCTGPLTREHLVRNAAGNYSDVFVFSHGWNNDWSAASKRYDEFILGYQRLRDEYHISLPPGYRPLLVGIFWPSTALVLPWEQGPDFAAATTDDEAVRQDFLELDDIAQDLPAQDREQFYSLAQLPALTNAQTDQLAALLAPRYAGSDELDPARPATPPDPPQLASWWKTAFAAPRASPEHGFMRDDAPATVQVAGGGVLDPRGPIRAFTVWRMKDRAGTVGAVGVGALLRDVLRVSPQARVHLIGHSYGAKVVLSALCAAPIPRKVDSVLLLQPAVNQWCFAKNVANKGFAGGYRAALDRSRLPIMTTYTRHDQPLTQLFHLAVRRKDDLGEVRIAADTSPYAALGGFGPAGCEDECERVTIKQPAAPYQVPAQRRVIALEAHDAIKGHGDISNPATWWALHTQVHGTN